MIDDQPAMRAGLTRLITARFPGRLEVHAAESVGAAIRQLSLCPAHLVILDVDLAGEDGLDLMPHLPPECRVLVFTSQKDSATRIRAMNLGAASFLEKGTPASKLVNCLSALLPTGMQGEHPPGISGDSSAAKRNPSL